MNLQSSELILNDDGSIYHLNLLPEQLAQTVITVGDPERVATVSKYFDTIEHQTAKREFHTITGTYKNKRISVISTGIGTDNIDIVFNELDALVNIDFNKREIKQNHTALDIIRIGTSGSIQENIPVDSFVMSERGIGFDSLLHWYEHDGIEDFAFAKALYHQLPIQAPHSLPYVVSCDSTLAEQFKDDLLISGNTVTNVGFYGPQSRSLRLIPKHIDLQKTLQEFKLDGDRITNLEMETAGIYAMSRLLGHRALSLNAILANRATGQFAANPAKTIDSLIQFTLDKLVTF